MKPDEKTFAHAGWRIKTVSGPIVGDKESDEYRRALGAIVLPEMVFHLNRVELLHEASGTVIAFNALDALAGWRHEDLPPLQVRVAEEWRRAREHEIQQQRAVQLTYDWTFTTPYTCTVAAPGGAAPAPEASTSGSAAAAPAPVNGAADAPSSPAAPMGRASSSGVGSPSSTSSLLAAHHHSVGTPDYVCGPLPAPTPASPSTSSPGTAAAAAAHPHATAAPHTTVAPWTSMPPPPPPSGAASATARPPPRPAATGPAPTTTGVWHTTTDQIDRGLLMERDPILFYDEVPLYESDLDDNGVCALTVKLRVMPRCWLVLLRLWVRVDGSMVRLREARMFCRHDRPDKRLEVLQEVKHCEGSFPQLRAKGAPEEGPAYADADAAAQVFQAVAPVGLTLLQTRKLLLPAGSGHAATHARAGPGSGPGHVAAHPPGPGSGPGHHGDPHSHEQGHHPGQGHEGHQAHR
ncbi:hypothetical protein HYH03_008563 [Edaphochlamys debaryana]|uniref:TIP41-like protein n=1 Tax=Edaphochlamys debaryana TaxID=47281 RepID=A0A835Y0M5_9CHLO|nr:hypothetical protein HYH03_008563 [Edaphochlamys debaryana]|eukprot:KAG2493139.1 hypothetical protein HYH03_008563 [Edaphochlamys debaryana]